MDINVALLTDERTTQALCSLSEKLADHLDSTLRLDRQWARPHLTLYMTGYPEDAMEAVHRRVQWMAADRPAPLVTVTGWSMSPQGSLLLMVERTPELKALHETVIEALNPLRGDEKAVIWEERRARFGPAELGRLQRSGMPASWEGWSPHFTIGRIDPSRKREVSEHLDGITFCGHSPALGLGGVGPHGTFRELIEAFPLGKNKHAA